MLSNRFRSARSILAHSLIALFALTATVHTQCEYDAQLQFTELTSTNALTFTIGAF